MGQHFVERVYRPDPGGGDILRLRSRVGGTGYAGDVRAKGGEDLADLSPYLPEADDRDSPSRQLPRGVTLPVVGGLPLGEFGQLLDEVQDAGQRELRQRDGVQAGRGGERDIAAVKPRLLQELADSRTARLHPAEPGAVGRHACRVEPVEVEADVGSGEHRPPTGQLGWREVPWRAVVVSDVARGRQQLGGVEHLDGGVDRGNTCHVLRLKGGGNEHGNGPACLFLSDAHASPTSFPSAMSTATMRSSASSHCASSLAKHTLK